MNYNDNTTKNDAHMYPALPYQNQGQPHDPNFHNPQLMAAQPPQLQVANSSSLLAQYRNYGIDESELQLGQPVPDMENAWTSSEMNELQHLKTAEVLNEEPRVNFNPHNALPVMLNPNPNRFAVKNDSMYNGVKSSDPNIRTSQDIIEFFNAYNAPPQILIQVLGFHYRSDNNDNRRRVKDFEYSIDITNLIFPFGKITSTDPNKSINHVLEQFVNSNSRFKSLRMRKCVAANLNAVAALCKQYIRQLGWRRKLTVTIQSYNDSVRVTRSSKLASTWDSYLGRGMLILTVVGAAAVLFMARGQRKHKALQSVFIPKLEPVQIFEVVRPQLWCKNQSQCTVM